MSEHNYEEVWNYAMDQLHTEYKNKGLETEFKLWFNMKYVEDTISTITVSVASEFLWQTMISKGNVKKVEERIQNLTGQKNIKLKSKIIHSSISPLDEDSSTEKETVSEPIETPAKEVPATTFSVPEIVSDTKKTANHPQLLENYTFETFVPGDNSMYAYSASQAAAKNPGRVYNPILLYGGSGLGKTHLMQSIGNYIYKEKGEKVKICYVSAESFTNEFISSLASKTTEKFKSKYRKLDVLLLDDIHFLQGKESTQEELFHTFNALHDKFSQMVFTCDRPITELKGITDRLRTRFSNGLCIDLQPPNYETRRAILIKKLQTQNKYVPDDILDKSLDSEIVDYIAKNVLTNVRELESALTKILGYSELINKTPTIEIAQELLRDTISSPMSGNITIETIQKVVADQYNISLSDIKSKKRDKNLVVPHHITI